MSNQSENENQVGKVIERKDNYVTVEIERHSACKNCGACDFGMSGNKTSELELENTVNAEVGDEVVVDMEGKDIVLASFLIYLFPLFSLVLGLFLGNMVAAEINGDENLIGLAFGILFMGFSYTGLKMYDNKVKTSQPQKFKPKILKKLTTN
ncbi:SoxR reducing system RseC family protein [Natranaerobius thermophilus]|uniref:Positive regulator of sigma E, RseC/MucC n=1 Tax=Natranaerobius thermophilus (strain ATCC BAA-1301 / DSM 18059 / JW/NM-WN-LF) TaxID=457570 RepID=B2A247_NATTJ|nr:SoxR reducing system RseC family protein [Natranaerobius thermophilus]ACB84852.1 positive regulator of sigma E, RseC/MucC [Natranaerobius thermophilus JW/NM-WN-LF]